MPNASQASLLTVMVLSDSGSGEFIWSYEALEFMTTKLMSSVASMSLGGQGVFNAMKTAGDIAVNAGVTVVVRARGDSILIHAVSRQHSPHLQSQSVPPRPAQKVFILDFSSCTNIWAPVNVVVKHVDGNAMAMPILRPT